MKNSPDAPFPIEEHCLPDNQPDKQAEIPQAEDNQLKISVDGKEVFFEKQDKNILECLENAGIDVHYHCRDGFCGACRVTLECGNIIYPQGEPLAFVGEGEILTCCSLPTTDIKISKD